MMKSSLFSMLFVAAFAMLLAGCKDTPVDVAQKWHKATFKSADTEKALTFVSGDKMKETTKEIVRDLKSEENISFGEAKIDGDTATVKVTMKRGDDKIKKQYELEKENGQWKISKVKRVKD